MTLDSKHLRHFAFSLLISSAVFAWNAGVFADEEDQQTARFESGVCYFDLKFCLQGCAYAPPPGNCSIPSSCSQPSPNTVACLNSPCCKGYPGFPPPSKYCKGSTQPGKCSCGAVESDKCESEGQCTITWKCDPGSEEEGGGGGHDGPWAECPSNPCAGYYEDWDPDNPMGIPNWDDCTCDTSGDTPILVDLNEPGFQLTSPRTGVLFDVDADGVLEQTAWTTGQSGDAFLALDRNEDGLITSGAELFGNHTQQPNVAMRNGYLALAVFDAPAAGGNADGVITAADSVYSRLRFWIDANHDGISQPGELRPLTDFQVAKIHLDFRENRRTDEFGNQFRYVSKLTSLEFGSSNRRTVDVIFRKVELPN